MLNKNQKYTIEITGLTHEGQGVGNIDGFVVFVDGALPEETVEVLIVKVTKSYAVGKLLEIKKTSAHRVEPFCKVYKRCGGCSMQHLDYEEQLKLKADVIVQNLKRLGGIDMDRVKVHPAIGMEQPFQYRNKVQYPVGVQNGEVKIGFFANRSHDIIDSDECEIQPAESNSIREIIRNFAQNSSISIYDEASGKGLLRHVMVRKGFTTNELMVVLVLNGRKLPNAKDLVSQLTQAFSTIKSIYINVNTKKTNIILGNESILLFGQKYISDYIGKYKFNISPLSFFQVNPIQTEKLYSKALEFAALTGGENVFDLYCGIGTISLFLSEKAGKVIGVEVVPEAIADAKENARINGVDNAEFYVGEAEKVIPELYNKGMRADVVVLDPPRKGCDQVLLDTLVEMKPERIVYVSCNPATLARDVGFLSKNGFELKEVQGVDMFPWTNHTETVCLIETPKFTVRNNSDTKLY